MSIIRSEGFPLAEKHIIYNPEMSTDAETARVSAEVTANKGITAEQTKGCGKIAFGVSSNTLQVSQTGALATYTYARRFSDNSKFLQSTFDLGSYLKPSELEDAFNNKELNDFIGNLLVKFKEEVDKIYAGLKGARSNAFKLEEIVKFLKISTEKEYNFSAMFGLLYDVDKLNNLEPKNLLELAQLHYEYLYRALNELHGKTDAQGTKFDLTDKKDAIEAALSSTLNWEEGFPTDSLENIYAHVEKRDNKLVASLLESAVLHKHDETSAVPPPKPEEKKAELAKTEEEKSEPAKTEEKKAEPAKTEEKKA
ncbi:MAG: hypothetical protein HQM16_18805, partial [Deltaproteobacteria bacterium]|nr:hypothetical protein [Deltaproteobacteria bacterium]